MKCHALSGLVGWLVNRATTATNASSLVVAMATPPSVVSEAASWGQHDLGQLCPLPTVHMLSVSQCNFFCRFLP